MTVKKRMVEVLISCALISSGVIDSANVAIAIKGRISLRDRNSQNAYTPIVIVQRNRTTNCFFSPSSLSFSRKVLLSSIPPAEKKQHRIPHIENSRTYRMVSTPHLTNS